jgi:hypothetical protein
MAMESSLLEMDILQQLRAWMKIGGKPLRLGQIIGADRNASHEDRSIALAESDARHPEA